MEFIVIMFFMKERTNLLSSDKKNAQSHIQVQAQYIVYIMALNTCNGVAEESTSKFHTVL